MLINNNRLFGKEIFFNARLIGLIQIVKINRWIILLFFTLLVASFIHLDSAPPLWWDEGWTMNVAKNWVERGLYGQMLDGVLQPPGLSAAFPVVASVALSFRLFGVGIWQARLPGVIYMLGAILCIFLLADRLYGRKVAWTTLILLLLPFNEKLHPVLLGRQVLGEMPSLFYLLLGYLFLYQSLRGKEVWLIPAALVWAIAIRTKAQVPPFWMVSILTIFVFALYRRSKRGTAIIFLTGVVTLLAAKGLDNIQAGLLAGKTLPQVALDGYYSMASMVPVLNIRVWAFISAIAFGLPVIVGLIYTLFQSIRELRHPKLDFPEEVLRLSLLVLSGSWMAWYVSLAMYWPRYLFPSLFIGSIYAAAALLDFTSGLNIRITVRLASSIFLERRITSSSVKSLGAILITSWFLTISILMFSISYHNFFKISVIEAANYLNSNINTNALIESYEPQLQFLTYHRWHYPPDQVHVWLNKRSILDANTRVNYDPLVADPDYLVIGPSGGEWKLYESTVKSGAFTLIKEFGLYHIYERVR